MWFFWGTIVQLFLIDTSRLSFATTSLDGINPAFPETPKPLNEGIYLKSYEEPYYNLRYIP